MWPGQTERTQNSHVGGTRDSQNPFLGEKIIHKPIIGGGGSGRYIDLSDSTLRAMLDEGDPAANFYQYATPLYSISDRAPASDVFTAQSMIFKVPNGGILGADVLGFSAYIGALNLVGHSTAFTGASPSFRAAIRFYSDEIDPETIVWNDRAGLTLVGSEFDFANNIITSSTENGAEIDIDLALGGSAGAALGVLYVPTSIDALTIRAVEVLLKAPGCVDPTGADAEYGADITNPRIYLGDDA